MTGIWAIITNAISVKLLWPLLIASIFVNVGLGYTVKHFAGKVDTLTEKKTELESDIKKHKSLSEEVREQIKLKEDECARLLEHEKTKPIDVPVLDNDSDLDKLLDELRLNNSKRKNNPVNPNKNPKAP